jgi:hypothetical protein
MNSGDFYRQQKKLDERRERESIKKHQTLETYNIEQQEAQHGHIPDPKQYDVVPPKPTLLQRLKRLLKIG